MATLRLQGNCFVSVVMTPFALSARPCMDSGPRMQQHHHRLCSHLWVAALLALQLEGMFHAASGHSLCRQ